MDDTLSQVINLVAVVITFLVVFSILGVWAARHSRQRPSSSHTVRFDEAQSRHFSGQGAASVSAGELINAQYRVDFQFPDDVLVKVELIESSTGDSELILLKSGTGISDFAIEDPGIYRFSVEPAAVDSHWEFTIKPVGLLNRLSS